MLSKLFFLTAFVLYSSYIGYITKNSAFLDYLYFCFYFTLSEADFCIINEYH